MMKIPRVIMYKSIRTVTTKDLADLFDVEHKIINKNFQRNKKHFESGRHYILLKGEELKRFKEEHPIKEAFKFFSILYLWTYEGALLHAKSCRSKNAWAAIDVVLDEVYN